MLASQSYVLWVYVNMVLCFYLRIWLKVHIEAVTIAVIAVTIAAIAMEGFPA